MAELPGRRRCLFDEFHERSLECGSGAWPLALDVQAAPASGI